MARVVTELSREHRHAANAPEHFEFGAIMLLHDPLRAPASVTLAFALWKATTAVFA